VYAEDPARGFVPTGGRVLALREPQGDGVRVDSALAVGSEVGSDYDPMLAKVIAWGTDRAQALARLDAALAGTAVLGVTTNVGFVRALLAHPDVAAGRLHTALVEEAGPDLAPGDVPDHVVAAGALLDLATPPAAARSRWDVLDGWRLGEPAWARWRAEVAGAGSVDAWVRHDRGTGALVRVGDGDAVPAVLVPGPDGEVVLHHGGLTQAGGRPPRCHHLDRPRGAGLGAHRAGADLARGGRGRPRRRGPQPDARLGHRGGRGRR
jgi:acetyl-CoA/propionyl-CoA carboxylase, biotin carboxylase, biotin carboxyl carrier protein